MDKKLIRKHVLLNAVKFNGKANVGAVIGHILSERPELKENMKELAKEIQDIIKEVSKIPLEKQKQELKKLAPQSLEKKEIKKKEMPEIPNAKKGKVVTRMAPEPSKYNHIGHALTFLINYLIAKKYNGKCILRFEDTNPLKATKEYVDAMKTDVLEYLGIKPDKTVFVSNDIPKFYKLATKLVKENKAYVCFCQRERMQELRHEGLSCSCRNKPAEKNMEEWENMLKKKYKEGEATLRLKIDMKATNHVMRDPVIMRLCYTPHYLQKNKYPVWPMYDFENAIEEEFCGVTHILRSIEFGTMRAELQDYIKDLFNFKKQTIIQYGRFNIIGAVTQGREIRQLIEEKKVIGWDDPRLVTLRALKRRGIVKETFYVLAKEVGLSKSETNIDWKLVASINRSVVDSKVNRYFFVKEPKEITIEKAPGQTVKLDLHPDFPKRGKRTFKTKDKFYIDPDDYKEFKEGNLYRLMDCLNFTKKGNRLVFDSLEYKNYKEKGEKIIHWLPKEKLANVEILMPDTKIVKGFAENTVNKLKVNDLVQFERFGFCRLDEKQKNKLVFWFAHK